MRNIIVMNGKVLTPLFTQCQAGGRYTCAGRDAQGEFLACKLDNRRDSVFAGWYIFVSPEDEPLILDHTWCGNITGGREGPNHIVVRRRARRFGKRYDITLNQDIWKRMTGSGTMRVHLRGHPLDFRRHNLVASSRHAPGLPLGRGLTRRENGWQVQIGLRTGTKYIGRVADEEEGYRLYNRHLRALKEANPSDMSIQRMPYNQIEPLF